MNLKLYSPLGDGGLISKLPDTGTTIFTVMSQLALEHNAINLGQGFPDFMMSEELIALVNAAMLQGHNQYAHMCGVPLLREKLAQKIQKLYNSDANAETQITITPGGTYAIYTALTSMLKKDDEVIVFEPAYDSYIPNITVNGAKPVLIQLQYPAYNIPWHKVHEKITAKTRAIIINSPHNPTGAVINESDIEQLKLIIQKHKNIFIVSDEVYEHLIFDDIAHLSILRYPELLERSFVCFSFGKTYHCTGWKIGYCIASPSLMHEFRKVHQFNCFSVNSFVQYALAEFLNNEDAYLSLSNFIQRKRDYFQNLMKTTKFRPLASHGSYFQCYSYKDLSDENDMEFAIRLTKEYGVTAIPLSSFYQNKRDDKVLRFCFAKKEGTLKEAAERLSRL
ncbi:methionine aminotransferase [Parafilimonas terrae]|uniref:2-keto-4-methylthiobutyrate aminotransferase apoenzyme n=1 Tax=Parafilimonas terrae TaxID=1465490 RepID=A0A1I5SJX3_9BACT|nr:methionine aminotransferase [Parafilimonas terrae]SFP71013.1 2-keto-4-methylthiobutyrate aminotransferase apoenzyme [Parafilimonas terrae]